MGSKPGFKYKDYEIYAAAQQLRNDDGSPGGCYAFASVLRCVGSHGPLVLPVSWYPARTFATEQEATDMRAQHVGT
jgi:hypothetical protein